MSLATSIDWSSLLAMLIDRKLIRADIEHSVVLKHSGVVLALSATLIASLTLFKASMFQPAVMVVLVGHANLQRMIVYALLVAALLCAASIGTFLLVTKTPEIHWEGFSSTRAVRLGYLGRVLVVVGSTTLILALPWAQLVLAPRPHTSRPLAIVTVVILVGVVMLSFSVENKVDQAALAGIGIVGVLVLLTSPVPFQSVILTLQQTDRMTGEVAVYQDYGYLVEEEGDWWTMLGLTTGIMSSVEKGSVLERRDCEATRLSKTVRSWAEEDRDLSTLPLEARQDLYSISQNCFFSLTNSEMSELYVHFEMYCSRYCNESNTGRFDTGED